MVEVQVDIEDEIDEIEKKAADIGKQAGADDKGAKDEVPDYEIEEEEDKRLSKDRNDTGDKAQRKPLSNKEKRDLRKRRLAEKFTEKDAEINALRTQLQTMGARQDQIDNRLTSADKAQIDQYLVQASNAHAQAKKDYAAAFGEGDGVKATEAMSAMYETQKQYEKLAALKQQYEKQPQQQQQAQVNKPDPKFITKAKAWADKHKEWYNPNGIDEDSELARSISQVLANEGFDPKSDDFWEEMDERLEKRGIGRIEEDDEDFEDEKPAAKPRRRSAPVGGGTNRGDTGAGGKRSIKLPTSYINTLKQNGYWDDVSVRNTHIQAYLKNKKQNQS